MLGLAMPSVTSVASSFPGMAMNFATSTGWHTLWSTWPPRSKNPQDHQPQQEEKRGPQLLGSPYSNLTPQHPENLTATVSILDRLKMGVDGSA